MRWGSGARWDGLKFERLVLKTKSSYLLCLSLRQVPGLQLGMRTHVLSALLKGRDAALRCRAVKCSRLNFLGLLIPQPRIKGIRRNRQEMRLDESTGDRQIFSTASSDSPPKQSPTSRSNSANNSDIRYYCYYWGDRIFSLSNSSNSSNNSSRSQVIARDCYY